MVIERRENRFSKWKKKEFKMTFCFHHHGERPLCDVYTVYLQNFNLMSLVKRERERDVKSSSNNNSSKLAYINRTRESQQIIIKSLHNFGIDVRITRHIVISIQSVVENSQFVIIWQFVFILIPTTSVSPLQLIVTTNLHFTHSTFRLDSQSRWIHFDSINNKVYALWSLIL